MRAFLVDELGAMIEQLYDVPVELKNGMAHAEYIRLPVSIDDPSIAYRTVIVRISTFVNRGTSKRCLAFTDRETHRSVLGYYNDY